MPLRLLCYRKHFPICNDKFWLVMCKAVLWNLLVSDKTKFNKTSFLTYHFLHAAKREVFSIQSVPGPSQIFFFFFFFFVCVWGGGGLERMAIYFQAVEEQFS